jgi:DNA replication ATP-dependent helicase/nuclease Dna2
MPYFTKEVLSQYIRTECRRQMRLYLSPDKAAYRSERAAQRMPPPQPPRPGLEYRTQEGERWQAEKLRDLVETFGSTTVIGSPYAYSADQTRYRRVELENALRQAEPNRFLIEAEYNIGPAFEAALGISEYRAQFNLGYAAVRPDIIEILPPYHLSSYVLPTGEVGRLSADDARFQLRIIDLKLTAAEPSPGYFAEVAYYMIALSGWLVDQHLDQRFVVVPSGAIWAGSHEASHLVVRFHQIRNEGRDPSIRELREAMEEDLEPVPFEVFALRLRHFFLEELQEVLATPSWQNLEWHVDNRCKGCEYLGYPWRNAEGQLTNNEDQCMLMAQRQDHLSRVAFISRGASIALQSQGVNDVSALAHRMPEDPVFNVHQALQATRTVVSSRAVALQTQLPQIPPASGTSAVMPRWADLRIYLTADFDLGSAITLTLGLKAFWQEPRPYGSINAVQPARKSWKPASFIVDQRNLQAEQRELLRFLDLINSILTDPQVQNVPTKVQFYLWDSLQYDHLTRIIGRHLPAILSTQSIQRLAWLFPPEGVLPNYAMSTRRSPITIVREVVRTVLAAPIPHYYTLLEVARIYHDPQIPPDIAQFNVHPLFEDALSDQIPSERAHEIWSRAVTWRQRMRILEETVNKRLNALETVTKRLEIDLRPTLNQTAPEIKIGSPQHQNRLSFDGQLWYAFAKLNEALAQLKVDQIRAMPPHEREARFHSARLIRRLTREEERCALEQLDLPPITGRRVYEMRPESSEVKLREGDFNFALAPELPPGFLDQLLQQITQGTALQPDEQDWRTRMEDITGVSVVGIDRSRRLIALDPNRRWPEMLDALESHGLANFTINAILDPVHHDFFTKKLLAALRAIGNPPTAQTTALVRQATGELLGRGSRQTRHTPPADVLWNGLTMHSVRVARNLIFTREALVQHGIDLNPRQWIAWEEALSRRLQLIWGPPGTGKSRTARAVILGAALEADQQHRPIRILICASTYTAIDNVLLDAYNSARTLLPQHINHFYRLRSYLQQPGENVPSQIDFELNKRNPSPEIVALRAHLQRRSEVAIVGATPEQIHNLLVIDDQPAIGELFDLILIDEASQMDVAHAILALCSLSSEGCVVLAGDPKQLPPIHEAEAPVGLEAMVGSIYSFCQELHHVPPVMLNENYRSNATLVEFSLDAGYEPILSSFSPELRLNLHTPIPTAQPSNWPSSLYWTSEWLELLDPEYPAACFVYPEGRSSQWNQFEADAVASLIYLLHGRMAEQLLNERHHTSGEIISEGTNLIYAPNRFWQKGVGIVTPHKAQQGLIVNRLQQIFSSTGVSPSLIRDAVDTVERFQGQQRDVIVASFALGDPDAIQNEDEFLMSLNRFNVMASRARAKLIVLVSRQVVDHLSSDLDTLYESRLLKVYADSFCREARHMNLGYLDGGVPLMMHGIFRRRQCSNR